MGRGTGPSEQEHQPSRLSGAEAQARLWVSLKWVLVLRPFLSARLFVL